MIESSICSFDGCTNKRMSSITDICTSHRRQILRGEPLRPLKLKPGRVRNGMKYCNWCKNTLPISNFEYINGTSHNTFRQACRDCEKEYYKYSAIKSKYKLSKEEYDILAKDGCMACGRLENLHVDHDHSCCDSDYTCGKCIRGILCSRCNTTIGKLEDSPELLEGMKNYIVNYRLKK